MEKKNCRRNNRTQKFGPGDPLEIEPNDLYEEQEMVEDLNQRLEELLYFSDSDENFED